MITPFDIEKFKGVLSFERETLEKEINEIHDNLKIILKSDNYVLAEELKKLLLNLGKLYDLTDPAKMGKAIDVLSKRQ